MQPKVCLLLLCAFASVRSAPAQIVGPADHIVGSIPLPGAAQGDVAVVGTSLVVGQGSFGAGAQTIARRDWDGTITTLATGFNSLGSFAGTPDGQVLFVTDNGGEQMGAVTGDTLFAIFRRARRRVSLFSADREHIHHRLVRIGLHHRKVVLVLYLASAYLGLTAYSMTQIPYQTVFLFMMLLTLGGVIGLRTLQFIEERLETGLVPGSAPAGRATTTRKAGQGERRANGSSWLGDSFGTTVCEVGGFCEDLAQPQVVDEMCVEISSMLSRRLRVYNVIAEPVGPGRLLILLRTERLVPKTVALVQDGVAWYLEEHKTWYSGEHGFPSIRWIRFDSHDWSSKEPVDLPGPGAPGVLTGVRKRVYGS